MLAALDEAVDALDGRADPEAAQRALAVGSRAGERLRLSGEHTVVALAGSTGSGKSSLFNALAGEQLSPVGVRRPTTSKAHACVWGAEGATTLVQWLGVPRRQTVLAPRVRRRVGRAIGGRATAEDQLDGLVLLDLPDHDSTVLEHRLEVDRLVELVDLLVWVVDPQKYADQALHERYLRRLSGHSAVTVVVLNQVDTVNPFAAAECAEDLRRLLDEDGLRRSPVLTTSVRTGAGLLRAAGAAGRRGVPPARAQRPAGRRRRGRRRGLAPAVAAEEPHGVRRRPNARRLVEALATRRGCRSSASAVEESWRLRAAGVAGLAADPVGAAAAAGPAAPAAPHGGGAARGAGGMVRSSVPEPTPVQRAQVDTRAARGLRHGGRWAAASVARVCAGGRAGSVRRRTGRSGPGGRGHRPRRRPHTAVVAARRAGCSGCSFCARWSAPGGCCCSASGPTCASRTRRRPTSAGIAVPDVASLGGRCSVCCWRWSAGRARRVAR